MTEDKRDDMIRESGRAPRDQAEELFEERQEQAADTTRAKKQR
jgi:hypothetical protein